MCKFLFLFLLISLFQLAFSEASSYTSNYTIDNWFSVGIVVQSSEATGCAGAITGACGSTGAILPSSGSSSTITLSVQNTGQVDREGVEISQSLSFVPKESKISFEPSPAYSDSTSATWKINNMKKGESKTFSYSFPSSLSEDAKIAQVSAKSSPPAIMLAAPESSRLGEIIEVIAKSPSGNPVTGLEVSVSFPDGASKKITTDSYGVARVAASKEGFYTYTAEGYTLSKLPSTEVRKAQAAAPLAAASAAGLPAKLVSFLVSLAPLLAAIFITAVITFILYGFITQRKEPYQPPASPPYSPPSSPPSSPQQPFSTSRYQSPSASHQMQQGESSVQPVPSQQAVPEKTLQLDTQRLVELRKSQMWQAEKTYPNHSYIAQPTEKTELHEAASPHMIALSSISPQEGESTFDESELESTVRQLEEIRQKLQERKAQMQSMDEAHSAYVGQLSGKAKEKTPAPRIPQPKASSAKKTHASKASSKKPKPKSTFSKKKR